ncbi:MAG TPA: dynamin family protein [Ktedonobacterales bacterium]|jgi:GTPase SAR1 family protein
MDFIEQLAPLELPFASLPLAHAPEPVKAVLYPLAALRQVLWRREVQITFFGGFKAGKSTLLNAIVGWSLLPTRANRATGVITRMRHAAQASASVTRRGPDGKLLDEHILLDEIGRYVFLDLSGTIAKAPEGVEEVTIHLPIPLLSHACTLADTPGLMDTQALTERCYRELEHSDLAVMVLSAVKLLSEEERSAAQRAQELLRGNLAFIVNRLDMVDEEDRDDLLRWARTSLEGYGNALIGSPAVFATEARGALEARKSGQHQDDAVSGLRAFERWLEGLLDSPGIENVIARSRLGILEYALARARAALRAQFVEAQKASRDLERQENAALTQRQAQWKRQTQDVQQRLRDFKNNLGGLGESFVKNCGQQVRDLMAHDERWSSQEKLRGCFRAAIVLYASEVNQQTHQAMGGLPILLPAFQPGASSGIDLGAVNDPAAMFTIGAGMFFNDWIADDTIAPAISGWLNRTLVTEDARRKLLNAVELKAVELLPMLRQQVEAYLGHVEGLVRDYEYTHMPRLEPSPSLEMARQIEEYHQGLVRWADDFWQAFEQVKSGLNL